MSNMQAILITDDDTHNRVFLMTILHQLIPTVTIDHAINGKDAIELVTERIESSKQSYDLIFMDFKMPGLNGEETTNAIRKLESQAYHLRKKSIIITWSSVKSAPYPNADDWMPKPPSKTEVESILTTYDIINPVG